MRASSKNTQILLANKPSKWKIISKDLTRNKAIYFMLIPVIAYFLIFHYVPMYGAQIAFRIFSPSKGIWQSQWVGFKHFIDFFNSYYFWRLIRNTFVLNIYDVIFGFPAPIILALLLNEVKSTVYKRTVQSITYMPHFISIVVICGLVIDFLSLDGLINNLLNFVGIKSISFMTKPEWFRAVYVASDIWQGMGWGSIIYLAALSGIDTELYLSAMVDGANKLKRMWYITLPGIMPTVVILLILRMGQMMRIGAEKILLLYNASTYETADVISTFVYRKGLLEMNYSYGAAVGLFNSVINFTLLVFVNRISKKVTEISLW